MEHQFRRTLVTIALTATVCWAGGALAAVTPAQKCEAGKNKVAGKYAFCRHRAEAMLVTKGNGEKYTKAVGKCATKYGDAWRKLEAKARGACPSNGDELGVESVVHGCTANIATAVGGGALSDCPADLTQCSGDLATCQAALSAADGQRLETGQTICYDAAGTVIACAGTGQDGELQKGLPRSYTDNGDGTITDNGTGLMWEKHSDDGSLHDKDNVYTWGNAFAVKVAALNGGGGFAGHTDWRVPNVNELQSLVSYGAVNPSLNAAFNTACAGGCTVTTCSCTQSDGYWSATTYQLSPSDAWFVNFNVGHLLAANKSFDTYLRGVRGGS